MVFSLKNITKENWNDLIGENFPFLEYDFLFALEKSKSVGKESGWLPDFITVYDGNRLVGAIPLYLKFNSYGEYIFDWAWASAYNRAGIDYYPKYVAAIPYTPATCPKILVHPDYNFGLIAQKLLEKLLQRAIEKKVSSIHFLFCPESELDFLRNYNFLPRYTQQFHWKNNGYQSFADFLEEFNSKKRNQIKRERRQAITGLEIEILENEQITEGHLSSFYRFYLNTINRKWAQDYLKKSFFEEIFNFRDKIVMVMAKKNSVYVAGTLNFRKGKNLYGRYWGCSEEIKNLHFELCYYSLIEYAIKNGITLFEAGAQGEHKLIRGLLPNYTYSAHWLADPLFFRAIENYLFQEKELTKSNIDYYQQISPFKK